MTEAAPIDIDEFGFMDSPITEEFYEKEGDYDG